MNKSGQTFQYSKNFSIYQAWGYFAYMFSALLTAITLLLTFFLPFNKNKKRSIYIIKFFCNLFFRLNFKQKNYFDFSSISEYRNTKSRIYIVNHTSIFDSVLVYKLPGIIKTTMKETYLRIPFVNVVTLLAGNVIIRKSKKVGESRYQKVVDQLQLGSSFVLYPEGTRSPDSSVGKFHTGAFKLGKLAKVDLIPVVLDNWNVIRPGGLKLRDLDIYMKTLEPIRYEEYKDMKIKDISNLARHKIIKELVEIRNKRRISDKNYYRHDPYFLKIDKEMENECILVQ